MKNGHRFDDEISIPTGAVYLGGALFVIGFRSAGRLWVTQGELDNRIAGRDWCFFKRSRRWSRTGTLVCDRVPDCE